MKRNFDNYSKQGLLKIKNDWHYDLSLTEAHKGSDIYEASLEKHGNKFDAILDVALYFYYAGVEAGSRYENNKKQ